MKFILILLFSFTLTAYGQLQPNSKMGNADSIINRYQAIGLNDTLLNNEKTAIAEAEAILFNIFGKEAIESEKPYKVIYQNGCWFISGTKHDELELGGVFHIVLNATDGKAVILPMEK